MTEPTDPINNNITNNHITNNTIEVSSSRLTATLLNDNNFQSWVRAATLALNERDIYDHITGEEPVPDKEKNKAEFKQWRKNDYKAINLVINSMEPKISELFLYHNSSTELWNAVNKHFSQRKNHAHICRLKKEIHHLTQNQRTIIQYISDLKRKWEELNLYRAPTTDPNIIKEREQERVYQFLSGLDETYEPVRAQVLLATELPTLDDAMALLQGEESRRIVMGGTSGVQQKQEAQAMAVLRPNPNFGAKGGIGNTTQKCEHCKKEGHEKAKCWFLNILKALFVSPWLQIP